MPDPDTSNRERLLRLIDGGHEALKEFQTPIPVKPAPKKPGAAAAALTAAKKLLAEAKAKLLPALKKPGAASSARWIFALVVVLAAFHYALEALKTVQAPRPAAPAAAGAPADEAGIGLRLVGVDTSAPPVALLEDLKSGKTYFARVNEKVKDARVKKIEKGRVTVSVRGRTVELQ